MSDFEKIINETRLLEVDYEPKKSNFTMANDFQKWLIQQGYSRARSLRAQLHHMVPGSADFKRLQAELNATNARIKELHDKLKEWKNLNQN